MPLALIEPRALVKLSFKPKKWENTDFLLDPQSCGNMAGQWALPLAEFLCQSHWAFFLGTVYIFGGMLLWGRGKWEPYQHKP